ncbi:MAG: hypothetical protein PF636_02605 [Actinomycetota bacterium]|nr:hypothetical protein [Actinomycetota bacterium]
MTSLVSSVLFSLDIEQHSSCHYATKVTSEEFAENGINTTWLLLGGLVMAFGVVVAILVRRIKAERAA